MTICPSTSETMPMAQLDNGTDVLYTYIADGHTQWDGFCKEVWAKNRVSWK